MRRFDQLSMLCCATLRYAADPQVAESSCLSRGSLLTRLMKRLDVKRPTMKLVQVETVVKPAFIDIYVHGQTLLLCSTNSTVNTTLTFQTF
jgi:hypothetical protein